ncbi:hypothetical protein D5W64_12675 [Salmonella enterica subsp. enterica serovar Saintpaul]|nr:hypothetical protein [Salmonella enterica subsp. enterica serovar Saintpaul]
MVNKAQLVARLRHGMLKMSMPKLKMIIEMEIESIERMSEEEFQTYARKKADQLANRNVVTKKI